MPTVSASAEVNDEGMIIFAFDYPGASGWGSTEATAVERLRSDLVFTSEWLTQHGLIPNPYEPVPTEFDVRIDDRVPATGNPLQCDSEGFFTIDDQAYDDIDISNVRTLLTASRTDLLNLTEELEREVLDFRLAEDRRTIDEIMNHIALAEHWYMTRVAVPYDVPDDWRNFPSETYDRLTAIRNDVVGFLQTLESIPKETREEQRVVDGERWTIKKILRRFVWHELLHYKQLVELVPKVIEQG